MSIYTVKPIRASVKKRLNGMRIGASSNSAVFKWQAYSARLGAEASLSVSVGRLCRSLFAALYSILVTPHHPARHGSFPRPNINADWTETSQCCR